MGMVFRPHQAMFTLLCLCSTIAHCASIGVEVPHTESRKPTVGTSIEDLRLAVDDLRALIRAADDLHSSLQKAVSKHTKLLHKSQADLTDEGELISAESPFS